MGKFTHTLTAGKIRNFSAFLPDESTDTQKELLPNTTFDAQSPGPLLQNVQALIDAIGDGIQTTSQFYVLPLRVLSDLNDAMVAPLPHNLKRRQLRSFPAVMGLFALLRCSGLAIGVYKPKRMVAIDPSMLDQWN
ncbi:MAG: hypothetical protein AAFP90_13720 [Planctomycetota bacterium]